MSFLEPSAASTKDDDFFQGTLSSITQGFSSLSGVIGEGAKRAYQSAGTLGQRLSQSVIEPTANAVRESELKKSLFGYFSNVSNTSHTSSTSVHTTGSGRDLYSDSISPSPASYTPARPASPSTFPDSSQGRHVNESSNSPVSMSMSKGSSNASMTSRSSRPKKSAKDDDIWQEWD